MRESLEKPTLTFTPEVVVPGLGRAPESASHKPPPFPGVLMKVLPGHTGITFKDSSSKVITAVDLRKEWMLKGNKRALAEPGNDINKHRSQHARCWREEP